ncbi:ATP-binding protein [Streptomyces sp. SPB162]|uniref:ATP-binding protein n=1 Tax=Streptomyces sp. SPB162 TaxID=2940560 RepID=UPI002405BC1E|nr:ATP-binding protein [Streptomyces sp. SPB162]MDF9816330.1 anti-sigma regulatory factor (Ser/Thr protein kinase) [Streptomyces sp. SPB162]
MHPDRVFDGDEGGGRSGVMERQPKEDSAPRQNSRGSPGIIEARELRHDLRRADLSAIAETRRMLREQLRRWGVPGLVDIAELLTSELVTNALQHTDEGAVFTATLSDGPVHRLRVEVHDHAGRRPRLHTASENATSGRGLLLVQALADAWGVRSQGTGKVVWFELDVETA